MTTTDFQEATAQRILHIFKDMGHRRVLLADEVGLGKTMVAKRVIDLVKEWHKQDGDDFFKVVYICSNINIADQNIEKLGIANKMNINQSRLSMQHLFITLANKDIRDNAQNVDMPESIIPLTPSTSFRLTNSLGTAHERALMFDILKHDDRLANKENELYDFFSADVKNWDDLVTYYDNEINKCSHCKINDTGLNYLDYILVQIKALVSEETCKELCECAIAVSYSWSRKSEVINKLRRDFAIISIDMLDPDLVIMDEFQRFSDLLGNGESEQSILTQKFFDPSKTNTKILLLSATPYKLYSTLEEINEDGKDEHFEEFMKVMDFLFVSKDEANRFQLKWQKYSAALKRTDVKDIAPIIVAKEEAQDELYGVMCRTERFNSGIIKEIVTDIDLVTEDILAYAQGQKLLDTLELRNIPIEYVKSAPYLLSFMDKYELKKSIIARIQKSKVWEKCRIETLLLAKYKINNYKEVKADNGKLQYFHNLVFGQKHEKIIQYLLWVPASHPYYQAGGLFENGEAKHFSKFILFSSWEMVPRMVSCMMSYYAELYTIGEVRRLFGKEDKRINQIRYIPERRANGTPKDRYGENRLRTNSLLEYPCKALAELFVPKEEFGNRLSDIRKKISAKIQDLLSTNQYTASLPKQRRGNASYILTIMKMLDGCYDATNDTQICIPDNAIKVMTNIAIASPAVCAYRQSHDFEDAIKVGKAFVSLFNKAESAAIIDLVYNKRSDDDYYESALDYCVKGNLQSVLDEYAHLLNTDKIGKHVDEAIIGTSNYRVDTRESIGNEEKNLAMRTHFAISFIDKTITDKSLTRTTNIRKAFNSPFRPFILSSTSIGQEGLDFHWYARKIVHWNLPSNPIDLEQREGRINRYKCLAIRRNIAKLYGDKFKWNEMFEAAKELKGDSSDMVPYWCLPTEKLTKEQQDSLEYIERIVPLYPLSRDKYRYEHLMNVLSLYRMTLGQPRQEELLDLLKDMHLDEGQLKELTIDLCPFNKKQRNETKK